MLIKEIGYGTNHSIYIACVHSTLGRLVCSCIMTEIIASSMVYDIKQNRKNICGQSVCTIFKARSLKSGIFVHVLYHYHFSLLFIWERQVRTRKTKHVCVHNELENSLMSKCQFKTSAFWLIFLNHSHGINSYRFAQTDVSFRRSIISCTHQVQRLTLTLLWCIVIHQIPGCFHRDKEISGVDHQLRWLQCDHGGQPSLFSSLYICCVFWNVSVPIIN